MVPIDWSVTNMGTAVASGPWQDRIYLSGDATWSDDDTLVAERLHNSLLGATEAYTKQASLTLSLDEAGMRYILLVTDADEQVNEAGDEDNNLAVSTIQIELAPYADLAVSNVVGANIDDRRSGHDYRPMDCHQSRYRCWHHRRLA